MIDNSSLPLATVIVCLTFGPAWAADTQAVEGVPTPAPEARLERDSEEPIEVRALVDGQSLQQRLAESPIPQSGIDRKTIQSRPGQRRLGDVINRLPGVFLGGAPGENKDILLRGLDKEFTRFEFDGVQLPGAGEKREFQVNRISPLLIGEVRVIRNPSAEYESDGIAGRVIVAPRPIPEELTLEMHAGIGGTATLDADRREGGFLIGTPVGEQFGFNLSVDSSRLSFEKDKVKQAFNSGGVGKREIEDENKPNQSHNVVLDTAWFYDDGEFHFKPLFLYLKEDKDKIKDTTEPGKDPKRESENETKHQRTVGATISNVHHLANAVTLKTELGYYSTEEDKDKIKIKPKFSGSVFVPDKTEFEDEEKEDEFWQFKSTVSVPSEGGVPQLLKAGVHVRLRDRFRRKDKIEVNSTGATKDRGSPKDNYELEENLYMGFVQNEWYLTERWTFVAGVRVEHTALESRSGIGLEESVHFTDINPTFHTLFKLTDHLSLRGAVSRSLNRPKFDEIAPFAEEKSDRFVIGNPNLDPARSWNFDLGAEHTADGVFLGVNLFRKEITGMIEEVDTGVDTNAKDVFQFRNVGDGYIQGIELEQRLDLGEFDARLDGLSGWSNLSVFDSELTDSNGLKRGFSKQPDVLANLGLALALGTTGPTLSLAAKFIDEHTNFKGNGDRDIEDERWTLDLHLRQKIFDQAYLRLEVINVTDEGKNKQKISGTKTEFESENTGRQFFVGIVAEF